MWDDYKWHINTEEIKQSRVQVCKVMVVLIIMYEREILAMNGTVKRKMKFTYLRGDV